MSHVLSHQKFLAPNLQIWRGVGAVEKGIAGYMCSERKSEERGGRNYGAGG